jgi:hypothetical protein
MRRSDAEDQTDVEVGKRPSLIVEVLQSATECLSISQERDLIIRGHVRPGEQSS